MITFTRIWLVAWLVTGVISGLATANPIAHPAWLVALATVVAIDVLDLVKGYLSVKQGFLWLQSQIVQSQQRQQPDDDSE